MLKEKAQVLSYKFKYYLSYYQVVLVKNIDVSRGLVNGATGFVVGFDDSGPELLPVVKFSTGKHIMQREEWGVQIGDEKVLATKTWQVLILFRWL